MKSKKAGKRSGSSVVNFGDISYDVMGFVSKVRKSTENFIRDHLTDSSEIVRIKAAISGANLIEEVVYAEPATVVYFSDGSKEVAICSEADEYRKDMGLAICLMKHAYGKAFHKMFYYWLEHGDEKYRLVDTFRFGQIKINKEKIITFDHGLIGYPDYKKFALISHEENEISGIQVLQSLDDGMFAIPVIDPTVIVKDYNPQIRKEDVEGVLSDTDTDILMLTTVTIPDDIKDITSNLSAPVIINVRTRKAVQAMTENNDYDVKYRFYDVIKDNIRE